MSTQQQPCWIGRGAARHGRRAQRRRRRRQREPIGAILAQSALAAWHTCITRSSTRAARLPQRPATSHRRKPETPAHAKRPDPPARVCPRCGRTAGDATVAWARLPLAAAPPPRHRSAATAACRLLAADTPCRMPTCHCAAAEAPPYPHHGVATVSRHSLCSLEPAHAALHARAQRPAVGAARPASSVQRAVDGNAGGLARRVRRVRAPAQHAAPAAARLPSCPGAHGGGPRVLQRRRHSGKSACIACCLLVCALLPPPCLPQPTNQPIGPAAGTNHPAGGGPGRGRRRVGLP